MPSFLLPLEDLKRRSVMYWLPPGGRYNAIWADTWVIVAEIEPSDSEAVLTLLAQADVGAYVAAPGGQRVRTTSTRDLYIDREQHNRATDVLMHFLRGKDQSVAAFTASSKPTTIPPKAEPEQRWWSNALAVVTTLITSKPVCTVIKILLSAAAIALLLAFAYYAGAEFHPGAHPPPLHPLVSNIPGLTGVRN